MRIKGTKLAAALGALGLVLAAACSSAPPKPSVNVGTTGSRPLPAKVAALELTTQSGRTVTLASLKGKTIMVVPFLTLCQDVCPFTTGNLLQVQKSIDAAGDRSKVAVVEFSVDPGRDSQARLAAYAKMTGASWTMARADDATTKAFMAYFGMTTVPQPEPTPPGTDWWTGQPLTYDLAHSDGFYLIDAKGTEVFASAAAPSFHGSLDPTLQGFLSDDGRKNLTSPPPNGWTPADALAAISWAQGSTISPAG